MHVSVSRIEIYSVGLQYIMHTDEIIYCITEKNTENILKSWTNETQTNNFN